MLTREQERSANSQLLASDLYGYAMGFRGLVEASKCEVEKGYWLRDYTDAMSNAAQHSKASRTLMGIE